MHIQQGEMLLWPFIHITIETAGMSPKTMIRYTQRTNKVPDKMSKAWMPAVSSSISCANGHRKESIL